MHLSPFNDVRVKKSREKKRKRIYLRENYNYSHCTNEQPRTLTTFSYEIAVVAYDDSREVTSTLTHEFALNRLAGFPPFSRRMLKEY